MSKKFTDEKTIKKALKVKDFKDLPKEKYDDLAELLVTTRKDIAIGIINQLPEYISYAKEMLTRLTSICQTALNDGKAVHNDTLQAYLLILNDLSDELQSKRLTKRRRKKITTQMMEVAEKIAQEGTEHRNFILGTLKAFGQIGLAIGSLAVATVIIVKDKITK